MKESDDKYSNDNRGFHHLSKAWYGPANLRAEHNNRLIDQIMVGFYSPGGGTTGEFSIRWNKLGGKAVPKLTVYDDGWGALYRFSDLIKSMAKVDDENITADDFVLMLEGLGIKNMTAVEQE